MAALGEAVSFAICQFPPGSVFGLAASSFVFIVPFVIFWHCLFLI